MDCWVGFGVKVYMCRLHTKISIHSVPAVPSVCRNQRTVRDHKSRSLTWQHNFDFPWVFTDLTDLHPHTLHQKPRSITLRSTLHRFWHMSGPNHIHSLDGPCGMETQGRRGLPSKSTPISLQRLNQSRSSKTKRRTIDRNPTCRGINGNGGPTREKA